LASKRRASRSRLREFVYRHKTLGVGDGAAVTGQASPTRREKVISGKSVGPGALLERS